MYQAWGPAGGLPAAATVPRAGDRGPGRRGGTRCSRRSACRRGAAPAGTPRTTCVLLPAAQWQRALHPAGRHAAGPRGAHSSTTSSCPPLAASRTRPGGPSPDVMGAPRTKTWRHGWAGGPAFVGDTTLGARSWTPPRRPTRCTRNCFFPVPWPARRRASPGWSPSVHRARQGADRRRREQALLRIRGTSPRPGIVGGWPWAEAPGWSACSAFGHRPGPGRGARPAVLAFRPAERGFGSTDRQAVRVGGGRRRWAGAFGYCAALTIGVPALGSDGRAA